MRSRRMGLGISMKGQVTHNELYHIDIDIQLSEELGILTKRGVYKALNLLLVLALHTHVLHFPGAAVCFLLFTLTLQIGRTSKKAILLRPPPQHEIGRGWVSGGGLLVAVRLLPD